MYSSLILSGSSLKASNEEVTNILLLISKCQYYEKFEKKTTSFTRTFSTVFAFE